jgi:hypothetical protein
MKQEEKDFINYIRTRSRIDQNDLGRLGSVYQSLINHRTKKIIDWQCPFCVRNVIKELIEYSEKNEVIDESKINTIEQPTKPGKNGK